MGRTAKHECNKERGASALLFAVALPVLLGMAALVVDVGAGLQTRQGLQATLDLAALNAARHLDGTTGASASAQAAAEAVLVDNGYTGLIWIVGCGEPGAEGQMLFCLGTYAARDSNGALIYPVANRFAPGGTAPQAVRIKGRLSSPAYFSRIFGTEELDVASQATGVFDGSPLASLTVRTTLANVNSSQGTALNLVFGGLLGGNLNLSLVGWQGLVDADIRLADFFKQMGSALNLEVGDYDGVLTADADVAQVLQAMIDVLDKDGTAAAEAAIPGLAAIKALDLEGQTVRLGSFLGLASGTAAAGLDATVSVFDLTQALVQAANGENGLEASVPLSAAGSNARLRLTVVEPPQLSAVGNPELAKADPYGPQRIYVRTAQVRAIVSLELTGLTAVANLANEVLDLASPVTTLLNDVLGLKLVTAVGSLLGVPKDMVDIIIVPGSPIRIDVSLDVGGGEARVTNYNCPPNKKPESLAIAAKTAVADLRIGQVDLDAAFSSTQVPTVKPVALVDIGVKTCTRVALLLVTCQPRRAFEGGGIGFRADTDAGRSDWSHTYNWPPEIGEAPSYHAYSSTDIVSSVAQTINGIEILTYQPAGGGTLSTITMDLTGKAINDVTGLLGPLVDAVLAPVLDPTLNTLVDTMGVDIAKLEVGANLTCDSGEGRLVN